MIARFIAAISTFIVVLACSTWGLAGESARVLIVAPSARNATAIRLRDELAVLGFDVVVVASGSTPTNLAEAARKERAAAAARVETWPPEILLWVADDARNVDDTLRVSESLQGNVESEMLALRAVELLRGKLLPVPVVAGANSANASTAAPADEAPPVMIEPGAPALVAPLRTVDRLVVQGGSPKVSQTLHVRREKPSFMIGFGVLASPGGMSALFHGALGGRFPIHRRWSVEALLFVPITSGLAENANGEMEMRPFFFGGGLDYQFTLLDSRVALSLGAGGGPLLMQFDGRASSTAFVGASGTQWAALAYGRAGVGIRVHPKFRLRFDGFVGPVFPEPVLRIAGQQVARVGRPATFLTLGAEMNP